MHSLKLVFERKMKFIYMSEGGGQTKVRCVWVACYLCANIIEYLILFVANQDIFWFPVYAPFPQIICSSLPLDSV